jgi:hypothetical protein
MRVTLIAVACLIFISAGEATCHHRPGHNPPGQGLPTIPEPGTAILLGLGLMGLAQPQRKDR